VRIYLDDYREKPEGWTLAKTVEEAIELLENNEVTHISLDHDLGMDEKTGYALCKWMTANKKWPEHVAFHSANPVGVHNMKAEYEFYLKHKDDIDGSVQEG